MRRLLLLLSLLPGLALADWNLEQVDGARTPFTEFYDENHAVIAVLRTDHLQKLRENTRKLAAVSGIAAEIIIVRSDSPNAYVNKELGPRKIALTLAMVKMFAGDPDALAFIVAHEMGHLSANHLQAAENRRRVLETVGFVVGVLIDAKLGNGSTIGGGIGKGGAGIVSLTFDRDQEREADALAIGWIRKAGLSEGGALRLLNYMKRYPTSFFSNHPGMDERHDNIMRLTDPTASPEPLRKTDFPPSVAIP